VGGFVEDILAEVIGLQKFYRPLTTVVFGSFGDEKDSKRIEDSTIDINWATTTHSGYRLPFNLAFARLKGLTGRDDWSCGKSTSPKIARIKAISESREWASCGCIPTNLIEACLKDLKTAIDPRQIVSFHPSQYRVKKFPFKPFDPETRYFWTQGCDELSDLKAHVIADCVYFPYHPQTPLYTYANSSGVAAHPDKLQATKNAALELIERDSFMITYLGQLSLPTVIEKTLPEEIQKRIVDLRKAGFEIWVKDFSLDLAPVIFIFAQNEKLTFTMCAASSCFELEEALDHALMEIEAAVLIRLANGPLKKVTPSNVRTTEDHGALYEQKSYFKKADFLAYSTNVVRFRDVGKDVSQTWEDLLDIFVSKKWPMITIPLHLDEKSGGNNGLEIVRCVIPGVVPLSFGYRQEPCGMKRIFDLANKFGGKTTSYSDIPRFPHPYT